MHLRLALIGAGAALIAAGALAQPEASGGPQTCDGQKFEFKTGNPERPTKVTLCGEKDASSAEIVKMLDSAAATLALNERLAPEKRSALVAQIKAKSAEISSGTGVAPLQNVPAPLAANPAPPRPPNPSSRPPEYASLPPLPAPKPAVSTSAAAVASLPLLARPRLTIQCLNSSDLAGDAPCTSFERDTLVTIRAGENVPGGTSLRFVRGDASADVALAGLKRGKSVRVTLPRDVCAGVGGGTLEMRIVRQAGKLQQVVGTEGPFNLRC